MTQNNSLSQEDKFYHTDIFETTNINTVSRGLGDYLQSIIESSKFDISKAEYEDEFEYLDNIEGDISTIVNYMFAQRTFNLNVRALCLQKWRGIVTDINEDGFKAKLEDLTNGGSYEIGSFKMDFVPIADIEMFKLGAIFYWSIGFRTINYTKEKFSEVRFQRLPQISDEDFDIAMDKGNEKYDFLISANECI